MAKNYGSMGSPKEAMGVKELNHRDHGEHELKKTQPSVKSETGGFDMHDKAPGEQHMGGVKKAGHYEGGHAGHGESHGMAMHMGRAAAHLERDTERHEHSPHVGGHKNDHYTH